jgi:hypothetical protein
MSWQMIVIYDEEIEDTTGPFSHRHRLRLLWRRVGSSLRKTPPFLSIPDVCTEPVPSLSW